MKRHHHFESHFISSRNPRPISPCMHSTFPLPQAVNGVQFISFVVAIHSAIEDFLPVFSRYLMY